MFQLENFYSFGDRRYDDTARRRADGDYSFVIAASFSLAHSRTVIQLNSSINFHQINQSDAKKIKASRVAFLATFQVLFHFLGEFNSADLNLYTFCMKMKTWSVLYRKSAFVQVFSAIRIFLLSRANKLTSKSVTTKLLSTASWQKKEPRTGHK